MTKGDIVRFTFRVPEGVLEKIREEANRKGFSINSFILQILWEWVMTQKEERK